MPKYNEFEWSYFEKMKNSEWLWSNLLDPNYSEIRSKKEFDSQLQEGHHYIVKESKRDIIPTYMYHHDLKYSSFWLRMKERRIDIGMGAVCLSSIILLVFLLVKGTSLPSPQINMNLSPIDIAISVLMVIGLIIGGINLAIRGFHISKVISLLAYVGGCSIILFRHELAAVLYNSTPLPIIIFPVALLVVFLLSFSKKTKKSN